MHYFFVFLLIIITVTGHSYADDRGELIFHDDFERNESQEAKEELSNGWGSNSDKRANGNKQVDLRNGAMHIYRHKSADHGVSVTQPIEFKNGAVEMKFMLENQQDQLGLNFADLSFKEVHAGHLFVAKITPSKVTLQDLKTGIMALETRNAKQAGTLTKEQLKSLKSKQKSFPNSLELGKWHRLLVTIQESTVSVSINQQKVGNFTSAGIAHPTKKTLRLAVPKQAVVDDVKIWRSQ